MFLLISYKESHNGYGAGLKLVLGSSILSFLELRLLHKLALQMCDKVAGIHGVILN